MEADTNAYIEIYKYSEGLIVSWGLGHMEVGELRLNFDMNTSALGIQFSPYRFFVLL